MAKVAELRARIAVLEDEKMRMAFELKVRGAQTKVFPLEGFNLLGMVIGLLFSRPLFPFSPLVPFFFFLSLVGPLFRRLTKKSTPSRLPSMGCVKQRWRLRKRRLRLQGRHVQCLLRQSDSGWLSMRRRQRS